jgi:hypothetical protein
VTRMSETLQRMIASLRRWLTYRPERRFMRG